MTGYFTMSLSGDSGGATVTLYSNSAYKHDVTVTFSYQDSPTPVPVITPASMTLHVPCNGSVSGSVTFGGATGWTLVADASDGFQDDEATLLISS
jgi:hypothetical protein